MEIIDSQAHLNMVGLEASLAAMDAVGVDAVLIDEFIAPSAPDSLQIGSFFSDTGFRYETPMSEEAVAAHPDRFAYIARCAPDDPDLDATVSGLRDHPGRLALRIVPHIPVRPGSPAAAVPSSMPAPAQLQRLLRDGAFDRLLAAAQAAEVPVFLQLNADEHPGDMALLEQVARAHPDLALIVDHMGVTLPGEPGADGARGRAELRTLDRLAALPNVRLKWCHMIRLSAEPYPYRDLLDELHRLVDVFGPERIMWGSDWTIDVGWNSWAESLFCIREDAGLGAEDKAWILGGTVRDVLRWER
jgi:L-fuconolactonase